MTADIAARLHRAADQTNDARDHDELHAAGAVVELSRGTGCNLEYIGRWISGLLQALDGASTTGRHTKNADLERPEGEE